MASAAAQPTAASQGGSQTQKSPWVATGLAVGVTASGFALGAIADAVDGDASSPATIPVVVASLAIATVGPSVGHWYAGERSHAVRWTAIRAAGMAAGAAGLALAFEGFEDDRRYAFPAVALAAVGLGTYMVGMYWSLYDAHRAVRRTNRRSGLVVSPMAGGMIGLRLSAGF